MYSISLQTSKPVVTADDIIGIVNFAASNEEDLRDSIFVGATISAVAEDAFDQVANPTSLVFNTANSGPTNEQLRITSAGDVRINLGSLLVDKITSRDAIKKDATQGIPADPVIDLDWQTSSLDGTVISPAIAFRAGHFDNKEAVVIQQGDSVVPNSANRMNHGQILQVINNEDGTSTAPGFAGMSFRNNVSSGSIITIGNRQTYSGVNKSPRGEFVVFGRYANSLDELLTLNRDQGMTIKKSGLTVDGGSVVFNEAGGNNDFRVEGDTDPNLLFVDASTDNVGIGLSTPVYKLDVGGDIRVLGNRSTIISGESSHATTKQASVGGWSFNHNALSPSGADFGGFGWYGSGEELIRYYMGPAFDSTNSLVLDDGGKVGIGNLVPETKLDVSVSAILDGIRVSGPALPSVQIVSTGDNSSHAIIGNNQGQLTIAADMTQVGGAASALQLGLKGETVVKITDAKAEVVDGTLAANTVNLGPSTTRHFSISRDTSGTFGNAIIQDTLGDIKLIAGSAVAIKIMNDSAGGTGGVRFYDEYTLPLTDGENGQVLKTDGNGNVTWQIDNSSTGGGGTVAGTGTAGYNARWTNATTLTDGIIQDNGSQVSVKTAITGRALTVGGTTNSNSAILIQGSGVPAGDGSRGFLVSSYGNGDAYLWNFESRPMIFATSNTEAMRIGSDGSLQHSGGTSAIIGGQSAYHIDVTSAEATIGGGRLQVKSGETVINEGGENVDFRVEGDTAVHLFKVDASEDRVGIGSANPTQRLDVYSDTTHDGIIVRGGNAPSIKIWDQSLSGAGSRIVDQNSVTTSGLMIIESDYNNVGIGSQIDFRVSADSKMRLQQDSNIIMGAGAGGRLPMAGVENRNSSIIPHRNVWEGHFAKNFPHGVANQKADIIFEGSATTGGGTTGYIEIEITSGWSNQNANGKIKKVISFIAANDGNGTIYNQESCYTEAIGLAPPMWAIGELTWNSTTNKYYIPIVHRQAKGNAAIINVRAAAYNDQHADRMFPLSFGDIYTTDTTVYEQPNVNVSQRLSVGGSHRAEYELDVKNNASVGDILIGNYAYTSSSAYQGITHSTWAGITQAYMMICDGQDTLVSSTRNTTIRCNTNDASSQMQITPILTQMRQDDNYVALRAGSTKFNENSNNVDFMVHGDTKLNMIYVDASADKVGVATSTPTETLTVNGGLENLYGWKWFSSLGNTVGQGPASGFLLQLNEQYGNILAKPYHYTVRLSTNSTGTDTGASYLIWWNNGAATWDIRPIGQANNVSNHPMVEITNDGTNDRVRVYTDNATPYPIRCQVESLFHGDPDCKPHSMGADYHWQRLVDDLYHTEGNVGIGISTPALQSAGKGLHINSDGLHSEIKFTNTVTGDASTQGVALVASNSSFTINNRSAGEVNINTNNINAISINSAQDVDVKQLLKVRRSNTAGTAGDINRVSFYDDGVTHSAGVGISSGNINYIAKGSIIQSFYTGGIKNLRLDPSGKVVMGASSNVVAGDASLNYNVGICTNAATNVALQVLKVAPVTGLNSFFNQYNRLTVPSGDLTAVRGVYQDMIVQNGADLDNIYGYATGTNTINAGGNVDTVIGYYVNNAFMKGSASNYGIYSDVNSDVSYPTSENKWGLFLAGTAPNYYRGGMKTSIIDGRNGSDYICERVAGGYKALGNTATNLGYLKIRLPEYLPTQKAGSTMITFDVSVYEYKSGGYKNFHFGGYVYWNTTAQQSQWINTTATMEVDRDIDNAAPWIVRFATDEDDYPCVLVGRSGQDEATNWSYGQIYIQNVRTGFGRVAWDQWSQNWQISLETRSTTDGGYYNVGSSFINKPIMHNQLDYSITAGSYDISSTAVNKIIINQNNTVFNENGVNTDFRVESDANQHMLFVDASSDVVGIGLSNPRTDAILHVGGPSSQNPTLMIGTGGNVSSSICSLKFQDRGPAADQGADGQITGYVQVERDGNSQNFDMTFGTVNTTAGDAVERMRIDKDGFVGIGTSTPTNLLNVSAVGKGSGTHSLFTGDDDSYMSVQNADTGDFLKLGGVYTTNTYMGLSHSDINNSGYMIMSNGVHTFLSSNDSGRVYIRGGKNDATKGEVRVGDSVVQVNPSSLNVDFIVYGDSVSQLLRTDASKDSVLIGNSTDGGVNSRLYVYDDGAAKVNVTNSRTLQVQGRAYTTLSGTHYHIGALTRAEKWMSGGATDTGYVIGLNAVPVVYSDSAGGQNTLSEITAVRANMSINSSLADGINVANAYDIKCIPSLAGTNSTVTNHFGLYLTSATNGATTVTNAYGVYQADTSASNIFAGSMRVGGTTSPERKLDVLGTFRVKQSSFVDDQLIASFEKVPNIMPASLHEFATLSIRTGLTGQFAIENKSNRSVTDYEQLSDNLIRFDEDFISIDDDADSGFRGSPVPRLKVYTKTGAVEINNAYTLPTTDGTSGQVLSTDGSGQVSWAAGGGSGGGSSNNLVSMCRVTTDPGGPALPTSVNFITSTFANPAYVPWWGFDTQTQTGNTDIFSVSGNTLTVSQAGVYQISANVTFVNTGANRAMAGCCLKYGNTMMDETIQYAYTRGTNYGVRGSLSPSITMFIAANGTIQVALWKESADQASALNTEISSLTVVRLGDDVLITTSPGQ